MHYAAHVVLCRVRRPNIHVNYAHFPYCRVRTWYPSDVYYAAYPVLSSTYAVFFRTDCGLRHACLTHMCILRTAHHVGFLCPIYMPITSCSLYYRVHKPHIHAHSPAVPFVGYVYLAYCRVSKLNIQVYYPARPYCRGHRPHIYVYHHALPVLPVLSGTSDPRT